MPTQVYAQLSIDESNARMGFSGEHAGMKFEGIFKKWSATLTLPPAENASIEASFSVNSAHTGDSTYDETLPEEDWFFVEKFPNANFTSTSIELKNNGYLVTGTLTLRNIENEVNFVLEKLNKGYKADFTIDRLAFDIGKESDPEAEWVSREIVISLTID
ncbi:YceI family protein [Agaribacter flavus]|uniref:YceI family protein n=1 Tax=Agaribacter flavus TaxID=1902781 RepID=A0ABV7FR98_9ALTE